MDSSPAPADLLLVALIRRHRVFAVSGAGVGVRLASHSGVCVLAFVAASGGEVMRDLLIGAVPPPR